MFMTSQQPQQLFKIFSKLFKVFSSCSD
uniref:Uncharacterized protein n=1 Tax=Arundo donax TaxID=35708 RepID=A0A0A9AJ56_ARUDO